MEINRPDPYKKRTCGHIIADLSVHHVEGFILDAGFTAERQRSDYGFDLVVYTFDNDGFVEEGEVYLQLKATDSVKRTRRGISFRIDIRDYRLWIKVPSPVFLVIYDAVASAGYWLYVQNYFEADPKRRPDATAKSVTVTIPAANVVDGLFPQHMRACNAAVQRQIARVIVHHE